MTPLESSLSDPPETVAPRLLGAVLSHGEVAVRITEVEAYGGADDPASHAFRGPTRRNAAMFGPPGRLYVYFTYGMHYCANVVTGEEGTASACLIRAGELVAGHDPARARGPRLRERELASGPARLCRALGLTTAEDGTDLGTGSVRLSLPTPGSALEVSSGPRVGIRTAAERPWRFWLTGDPTVSRYRAASAPRTPLETPSESTSRGGRPSI